MKIISRDILDAQSASQFIQSVKTSDDAGEIRQELEALPARIRGYGLLQTLAYLMEKTKEDRNRIGKALIKHLIKSDNRYKLSSEGELCKVAVQICRDDLCDATNKAYAYTKWLKLMAKAEIPKQER